MLLLQATDTINDLYLLMSNKAREISTKWYLYNILQELTKSVAALFF